MAFNLRVAGPTLAWTLPSLGWMWWRMASILGRKAFRHHMLHGTKSSSFYVHVVTGVLGLLIATVGYAYYMIPFSEDRFTMPFVEDPTARVFFSSSALVIVLANLSLLWLLPGIHDYKTYQVECQRPMARGLAILHLNGLQFASMAATALAAFLPASLFALRQGLLILSVFTYVGVVGLSILELCSVPWEETTFGRVYFAVMPNNRAPFGNALSNLHGKTFGVRRSAPPLSKVTLATVHSGGDFQVIMFAIFVPVGCLAITQCLCLLTVSAVHVALTNFFVTSFLYQTSVMSTGFFTMTQLFFAIVEKNKSSEGNAPLVLDRADAFTMAGELLFLQVLPIVGATFLGPAYTGIPNTRDFYVAYVTFRSQVA